MAVHNDIGKWGEEVAREYLIVKGYAIFSHNSRIGRNEIDIIATKGDRIAFVEVKTRSTSFGDPLDAIDRRKMTRMCNAANSLIQSLGIKHLPQFDVITVVGDKENYKIEHFEDAFRPALRTR